MNCVVKLRDWIVRFNSKPFIANDILYFWKNCKFVRNMYLPWPFMIWYCFYNRAELLLIFLLFSEPSLERLLLRLLLRLDVLECLEFLEFWLRWLVWLLWLLWLLLEMAPDSIVIVLSPPPAALFWFCRRRPVASMSLFRASAISDEWDRTLRWSARAFAMCQKYGKLAQSVWKKSCEANQGHFL